MREIMANYLQKNLESVATHKNTSLARRYKNTTKIWKFFEKLVGYVIDEGKIAEAFFGDFWRGNVAHLFRSQPTEKGRSGVDVAEFKKYTSRSWISPAAFKSRNWIIIG